MKGEYHWSHVRCAVITSGILSVLPVFPPFFFSQGGKKSHKSGMVKLQASEPTHILIEQEYGGGVGICRP